jgi:hypothetical protein
MSRTDKTVMLFAKLFGDLSPALFRALPVTAVESP